MKDCLNSYLKVLNFGLHPLEKPVKLQVRLKLVEENNLAVDIFTGGMEKVGKESTDTAIGDVTADNDELLIRCGLNRKIAVV